MRNFELATTRRLRGPLAAAGAVGAIVCVGTSIAGAHRQVSAGKPEPVIYQWKEGASDSEMVGNYKEVKKLSGGGIKVYVMLEKFSAAYSRVRIKVVNETQEPLRVDPKDIKLEIIEPVAVGPISAVPEKEVEKKVEKKVAPESSAIPLSDVLPGHSASTLGVNAGLSDDQKRRMAQAQAEADLQAQQRSVTQNMSKADSLNQNQRKEMRPPHLRAQTIAPGGSTLGVMYFARNKKGRKAALHVRLDGNQYDFPLDVSD
jgi:hypothetical protein